MEDVKNVENADLYKPKNVSGKYSAIAVSGPFGAVKEQCPDYMRRRWLEQYWMYVIYESANIKVQ